jgi:Protein of unknown function (DUF2853)
MQLKSKTLVGAFHNRERCYSRSSNLIRLYELGQLKQGIIMADYAADIKKYTSNVNAAAVEAIVKFCGIALKGKDSQFVSMTDPAEVKRVVDGFCAKKLGLAAGAAEKAVLAVGEKMKADKTKHRVTVYYLVAEATGTMGKLA